MKTVNQKGFTLIELMISIVLGLIITAAVAKIYITGVRNAGVQKAAAGVLDANVFGMQHIERNLRMAGLGLGTTSGLNRDCGGIIVSSGSNRLNCDGTPVIPDADPEKMVADIYSIKLEGLKNGMAPLKVEHRTKADGGPTNTSNTHSSQLTIQYRAPVDMRDCEGKPALGQREVKGYAEGRKGEDPKAKLMVDGQVIVERYFIKRNDTTKELELRCDAGRYVVEHVLEELNEEKDKTRQEARAKLIAESQIIGENSSLQGMGDDGALIISGIDDFQVQLGVSMPNGAGIHYQNIDNYTNTSGSIVAVRLGILAKGNGKVSTLDSSTSGDYTLFGQSIKLANDQPTNAIRRVYETTTMLRNSREAHK